MQHSSEIIFEKGVFVRQVFETLESKLKSHNHFNPWECNEIKVLKFESEYESV